MQVVFINECKSCKSSHGVSNFLEPSHTVKNIVYQKVDKSF